MKYLVYDIGGSFVKYGIIKSTDMLTVLPKVL